MTAYETNQAGGWGTAAIWTPEGTPGTGDTAELKHNVTGMGSARTVKSITCTSGILTQDYNLTFDDAASAGITIAAALTAGWNSGGTYGANKTISSASAVPANPWTIKVYDVTSGTDTRTLNFDYTTFAGNKWNLGNDTYIFAFNDPSTSIPPTITNITPLTRSPNIVEHLCKGRGTGRVYQLEGSSGSVTISGVIPVGGADIRIKDMVASLQRISLFTQYTHLPRCRVSQTPIIKTRPGGLYQDFTMTLIEDA